MNYRHSFHAGNHADVLKHAILLRMVTLMQRKDAPLCYLDSHAGTALYDLQGEAAERTGEYRDGIGRLWAQDDLPGLLADYRDAVARHNPDGELRLYPGSPQLVADTLREHDRMILSELHPEDAQTLKAHFAEEPRIAVHQRDGYELAKAFLPVAEKRALWLLDPPFEKGDDLQRCLQAMEQGIQRMRQTVIALWYPIKDQRLLRDFYRQIGTAQLPKVLRVELNVRPADTSLGLNGSGLMLVNPPWPLWEELEQVLPQMAGQFAQSGAGDWRMDWLVGEP
ncbi:23S rRNA (adenine(2030)-N(6))-methyltransferase RlmJ [Pseudomonas sp. G11-1]|uniref:Ribosomal RNA large subunit methyltransferase J n=1 Tax=Halopseudomonas bauzanensis TaxID=653930 RepID=A0A031MGG3_9GAMM|nr:23S rRNA (adenine(2030)-N(6))-methyltransferase RlmJ [Halopseudomonas bauzanensis]MCO5785552.1 23S rRNA (adenine(2030)-N(6))-methyltransferase RlmJ [Pseudomonas sp. G11-1]MCO5788344.1 23S rRNA (adenine(2030)-N(6))-methyltransferase RlmJ [Pseudomonas sp. G11-2]EZQ19677.1 lactate dehydrogenase [Halopseudomonas bauzanensis]TKA93376.1 23S rRNA (adenine(2030)-N(6))-methyltransferase RlmJ [Halopseudomonas bauzanensis]SER42213.1 23S rRNA (adenine2030-N6)-methyltransferase [Halopseudomonas bauzanen